MELPVFNQVAPGNRITESGEIQMTKHNRIACLILIFTLTIGSVGGSFAEGASALFGTWAFDYAPDVPVLKVSEDGTAVYNGKDYRWDDQEGFLLLKDEQGESLSLRYVILEDRKVIYPKTTFRRGKEVEGQGGLIGVWEGTETESSFVFTPAGYFLEDSVFSGNFLMDAEKGSFLLHYGDVFADTLCYYSIENDILTVEYPWTLVEIQS